MTDALASLETVGSGSYARDDVHVLLRPVCQPATDVREKEQLIQTNRKHYSEMIGHELAPDEVHRQLYVSTLARNGARMAADVQGLAQALDRLCIAGSLVLVSLVRAGLPLGVLLRRALLGLGREAHHYGISIVRDRGIDQVALEAIIRAHGAENLIFVDGWTGKGAIAGELERSLAGDPRFPGRPRLVVLADPCGRAWMAASAEDWVIPSGLLGATVSGLLSRSIWPAAGGLHGCLVYEDLEEHDVTRAFIEHIERERRGLGIVQAVLPWSCAQREALQSAAGAVVSASFERYCIDNPNRVKPGIAEATRAVLRRVPERVLVRDRSDRDVQLLLHLARSRGVTVEEAGAELGPYRALTLIRSANR